MKRCRHLYQPDNSVIQLPSKQFMISAKQVIAANSKINSDHNIEYSFRNAFCFSLQQLPEFSLILSQLLQNKHYITPVNAMEVFKANTNAIELKMRGRNAGSSEGQKSLLPKETSR